MRNDRIKQQKFTIMRDKIYPVVTNITQKEVVKFFADMSKYLVHYQADRKHEYHVIPV